MFIFELVTYIIITIDQTNDKHIIIYSLQQYSRGRFY